MIKDNWIHKSDEMLCKTCMYFCNYRCRRNAPTIKGFPAIYRSDWCGDHKLDKNTMVELEKKHV